MFSDNWKKGTTIIVSLTLICLSNSYIIFKDSKNESQTSGFYRISKEKGTQKKHKGNQEHKII